MKLDIKSENGAAIAVIKGEIDHHTAKSLRAELDKFVITADLHFLGVFWGS